MKKILIFSMLSAMAFCSTGCAGFKNACSILGAAADSFNETISSTAPAPVTYDVSYTPSLQRSSSTNGNTCIVDAQCGLGRCIKGFGAGTGTCAGDVN